MLYCIFCNIFYAYILEWNMALQILIYDLLIYLIVFFYNEYDFLQEILVFFKLYFERDTYEKHKRWLKIHVFGFFPILMVMNMVFKQGR